MVTALVKKLPNMLGGDADLSVSTKTAIKELGNFDGQTGQGRNIRYGVREHAMGGIANGLAYHGGVRPYTATFFCFADYERPALRLAALSHLPVVFVFTHDSIGLGEDGPTHQPVEHLASLRAMPNMWVIRPGDANETAEAWRMALERKNGPSCIVLSRQTVPTVDRSKAAPAAGTRKGGYVLFDAEGGAPQAILLATGSELPIAVEAREKLMAAGVRTRLVSLPCWEAFAAQDQAYQQSVLPAEVSVRVSIEAAATFGWRQWIGDRGVAIGLDRFGASAPYQTIYKELGLTADHVVQTVQGLLK